MFDIGDRNGVMRDCKENFTYEGAEMATAQEIVDKLKCDTINVSGIARSAGIDRKRMERIIAKPVRMTHDEATAIVRALESVSKVRTAGAA